ncbi:MAG: hypothetical protein P8Y36_11560, partial [Alphaproteobacteria bacterium]
GDLWTKMFLSHLMMTGTGARKGAVKVNLYTKVKPIVNTIPVVEKPQVTQHTDHLETKINL